MYYQLTFRELEELAVSGLLWFFVDGEIEINRVRSRHGGVEEEEAEED